MSVALPASAESNSPAPSQSQSPPELLPPAQSESNAPAGSNEDNANGDLDILDGGDLTIQGNGATNTIIDGNGTDRVFHVCSGGGCANTVTFNGVTIRNGSADFGVAS